MIIDIALQAAGITFRLTSEIMPVLYRRNLDPQEGFKKS